MYKEGFSKLFLFKIYLFHILGPKELCYGGNTSVKGNARFKRFGNKLQEACAEGQANWNFFKPFMCTVGMNVWITAPVLILIIYFVFCFIGALVDEYIGPSIMFIKSSSIYII